MGQPLRVGIVGVGAISGAYLSTFRRLEAVRLVAVADLDGARAASVAAKHGVRALTVDQLTTDPEVELVLNLTTPAAHAEIALKAIAGGKSVYGEKPLAATLADARAVIAAGRAADVRVGCASVRSSRSSAPQATRAERARSAQASERARPFRSMSIRT